MKKLSRTSFALGCWMLSTYFYGFHPVWFLWICKCLYFIHFY